MKLYFHPQKISLFLLVFLSLVFSFKEQTALAAKEISLQKTSINLFLNEEKSLKVLGKNAGDKITFQSTSPSICRVSKSGRLLALSPGDTSILVKVISKKGKVKKNLKATVKVKDIILASTQENLERGLKNPLGTTVLLKPKKETSFFLPKGNFPYSLQIDMGKSQKEFLLKTDKNSYLKEIQVKNVKKASFFLKGEISSLSSLSSGSSISVTTSGKKALLSQIHILSSGNFFLQADGANRSNKITKVYLSKRAELSISGKPQSALEVYSFQDASDSKISSNKKFHYYASVPSLLELKKGAEGSLIRTLDYKVSVTVKNGTSSMVEVQTPSLLKAIPAGEEKTVNGKK